MSWRGALAAIVVCALGAAAPAAADFFDDPPFAPADPTAAVPVVARVLITGCSDPTIVVVRTDNVIALRYDDPGCPVLPPGPFPADVPLGVLEAGTYDVMLVNIDRPLQPVVTDEKVLTVAPSPCGADALCLQHGRFAVTAQWTTRDGSTGIGHPVPLSDETGAFWFFTDSNDELMVKVLDGCALNDRFWVYAGGLTDVQVTLTVRDLYGGPRQQSYSNPLGQPFAPIRDTGTFICTPVP